MKLIGLLGAVGWKTTATYFRMINEYTNRELGGGHSARILMHSINSHMLLNHHCTSEWPQIAEILTEAGHSLKSGGADFFMLTSNSMHMVADLVSKNSGLDLLHIAEPAGAMASQQGHRLVGLIGTRKTMESEFYQTWLRDRHAITVITPDEADCQRVDDIIFKELANGIIQSDSRHYISDLLAGLHKRGAEAVILGCSEITSIVPPDYDLVPVYDTTRLHARAAVERALGRLLHG